MEVYRVVFDGILTILKRPVEIGNVKFSLFGLVVVAVGADLVSMILKAIFGGD